MSSIGIPQRGYGSIQCMSNAELREGLYARGYTRDLTGVDTKSLRGRLKRLMIRRGEYVPQSTPAQKFALAKARNARRATRGMAPALYPLPPVGGRRRYY